MLQKKFLKSSFFRNVIALTSGAAIAQGLSLLATPIITRLYTPEVFGVLGTVLSIISVVTPVAALAYHMAIVLPDKEEEVEAIVKISIRITLFFGFVALIAVCFLAKNIEKLIGSETNDWSFYFIPLIVVLGGYVQILQQYNMWLRRFRKIAKATVLQSFIANLSKIAGGFFYPFSFTLLAATAFGMAVQGVLLISKDKRRMLVGLSKVMNDDVSYDKYALKKIVAKYRSFPLYRAPQMVLNAASHSMPVLLLASYGSVSSAGFYVLSKAVLMAPVNLIGKSVFDVSYPRFSQAMHAGEDLVGMLLRVTSFLLVVAMLPFSLFFLFAPEIFGFIFGGEWVRAGEYASWMSVWLLFGFINRPSIAAIQVLGLLREFLLYEVLSTVARAIVLLYGLFYLQNEMTSIILLSICGAAFNFLLILYVLINSYLKYQSGNVS